MRQAGNEKSRRLASFLYSVGTRFPTVFILTPDRRLCIYPISCYFATFFFIIRVTFFSPDSLLPLHRV